MPRPDFGRKRSRGLGQRFSRVDRVVHPRLDLLARQAGRDRLAER